MDLRSRSVCSAKWSTPLLLKTNLRLLAGQLATLAETPYFSPKLNSYLNRLREVADKLLQNIAATPDDVARLIVDHIWQATQYLSGSTSKRIPYEVVFGLRLALNGWITREVAITTAIIEEQNFYFREVDANFYTVVKASLGLEFDVDLIQIELPEIYRHRPLYNVALYHELGHFIDRHLNLTELTLLLADPKTNHILPGISGKPAHMNDDQYQQLHRQHRGEFWADLFAASYAGRAYKNLLAEFAANNPVTYTHPATYDRLQNIEALLTGSSTTIIDLYNVALRTLGLSNLNVRYTKMNLRPAFDNVRPFTISSDTEVHGILEAGAEYLAESQKRKKQPWNLIEEADIERIINDLVEKSIRNRMINTRWNSGAP